MEDAMVEVLVVVVTAFAAWCAYIGRATAPKMSAPEAREFLNSILRLSASAKSEDDGFLSDNPMETFWHWKQEARIAQRDFKEAFKKATGHEIIWVETQCKPIFCGDDPAMVTDYTACWVIKE
jgi:hypothetical protein